MIAIQDQVIDTANYQKYIIRRSNYNDSCRQCHGASETVQHITGACRAIAQTVYINTPMIKYIYYKYKPQAVLENERFKLYWDRTITDKTIYNNRPDITMLDKQKKLVYIIDIAICNTHNLTNTHSEKIAKYTDLSIEIKTQWKITHTKTVPIILSSTGVIPKSLHHKGYREYNRGCKEQLTIDAVVMNHAVKSKTDIHTMFVDYQKAFDSVPRGIFQGGALGPLWFCMALNPLSHLLNKTNAGYTFTNNSTQYTISHLMYMDDIKLYAADQMLLSHLADVTQQFSTDICMQFGEDKCTVMSVVKGKFENNSYTLETGQTIEPMEEHDTYQYLRFRQSRQIRYKNIRQELIKKITHRLNLILKTNLHARNTIKMINTFAIPLLAYSFGIIQWSKTNIRKLQRIINTTLTKHRKHYYNDLYYCSQKALHGRHRSFLSQQHVYKIKSNEWLKRGELFSETEGFMLAIQDQTIVTRNYRKFIMRDPNQQNDLCQHCNLASETIQHITGACKSLAQTDYKHRHDQNSIPDRYCHSNSHNIQSTISEKLSKYQDLAIEIKTQRRAQTVHIVPIVLSTTGIIPKSLTQSLNTLHTLQKKKMPHH
uniref:SFRICE_021545 n=1 Tax=Spodoptera frugiperda TaxID=7108 RepID=A0A2H1W504_SPOFR